MSRAKQWLEKAYATPWGDKPNNGKVLQELYHTQFDLMDTRDWIGLNEFFEHAEVEKLHVAYGSAMLRGCYPARRLLPNWHLYLDKLLVHIHAINENPMLLVGLIESKLYV